MHLSLLLTKIGSLGTLSEADEDIVRGFRTEERCVEAGQTITFSGDHPTKSSIMAEGFACTHKMTGSGARQIIAVHVPGDAPDLRSLHLQTSDVTITTVTAVRLHRFLHADVVAACQRSASLNAAFWRMALVDGGIAREWIVNLGKRDARTRLAHFLCELYARLDAVGLVQDGTCAMPFTQSDLADVTGITPVHVNRALQILRSTGLIRLAHRRLTIPDFDRLAERGDFDPMYLQLV